MFFAQDPASDDPRPSARIDTEPEVLNFGEVFEGEEPMRRFRIMNRGRGDLEIIKIEFTCGCTLSRMTLPSGKIVETRGAEGKSLGILGSGESAEVEIAFGTSGLLGEVRRHLRILSNDPDREKHVLPLEVKVVKPFHLEPAVVDFGEVTKGQKVTKQLLVRSAGVGDFAIRKVTGLPPGVTCCWEPVPEAEQCAYQVCFTLEGKGAAGFRRHRVHIEVENARVKQCGFFLYERIRSDLDFRIEPLDRGGVMDFGKVIREQGAVGVIEITNRRPEIPLGLPKVQTLSRQAEHITVAVETLEPGRVLRITVTLKAGIPSRHLQGTLLFYGGHPDLDRSRVKFMGLIHDG